VSFRNAPWDVGTASSRVPGTAHHPGGLVAELRFGDLSRGAVMRLMREYARVVPVLGRRR